MGLFGKKIAPRLDSSCYTPDSELTAEEKAEFALARFTLGRIPERPPSKELCV